MKVIEPISVNDARLTSSSLTEADYPAWASGTTYADGDRVILVSTHRIYESLQGSNTNHAPTEAASTWWLDVSPTNRWAMFDTSVSTATTGTNSIAVTLTMGQALDSLALVGLANVQSVTVTMTNNAVQVYSRTVDLAQGVSDWYGYFFDPIATRSDLVLDDLPLYADGVITVTATGSGTIGIGAIVLGRFFELGGVKYGAGIGITDYSKKDTDAWGNTVVVQRAYAKRMNLQMLIDNPRLDAIVRRLAALRAVPSVWYGSATYTSLIAYGFYKDFNVEIAYPANSLCSLQIEGLTQ